MNGDMNACKADCSTNVCGDGAVGPGEGCDDGNEVDDDECTNACARLLRSNLGDFVSGAVWPCRCSGVRHARMRTAGHLRPAPDPRLRRGGARAAALAGLPRAPRG